MDAVLLGLLAGALFGAMTVAVRAGLVRGGDSAFGGVVIASSAFVVSARLALPSVVSEGLDLAALLAVRGRRVLRPGLSQLLFILAVRYAGPSRAAILIGTAPLGSVLLAMALLDEPLRPGAARRHGPDRRRRRGPRPRPGPAGRLPDDRRRAGAPARPLRRPRQRRALDRAGRRRPAAPGDRRDVAGGDAGDGAVRPGHPPGRLPARSRATTARAFVPAGVLLAFAYGALVTGFDRGDVSIVAPLNATQSLWGVAFAALVYGQREAIGRRTVLASVLIVLGGALIGAFR